MRMDIAETALITAGLTARAALAVRRPLLQVRRRLLRHLGRLARTALAASPAVLSAMDRHMVIVVPRQGTVALTPILARTFLDAKLHMVLATSRAMLRR